MIDEVKRLFANHGSGLRRVRRSSPDITFPVGQAPSAHELALTLATGASEPEASGQAGSEALDRGLESASAAVAQARISHELTEKVRNIDTDAAKAGIAAGNMFSATALEAFIECPYKWFFERAMRPTRFGSDPDAIAKGKLIHLVLAELYRSRPGQLPSTTDIADWCSDSQRLIKKYAKKTGLGDKSASHQIQRRQVAVEIERFLTRESDRSNSAFRPFEFEGEFGKDYPESKPALDCGTWTLRGSIDRIDKVPAGEAPDGEAAGDKAVVIDYKSGGSGLKSLTEIRREGKVQLQLYLRALEKLWGLDPVAGLYVPVFASKSKPRGMIASENADLLKDMGQVSNDITDQLGEEIEAGFELAAEAAGKILRGEIAHEPSECLNHFKHAGVPDWIAGSGEEATGGDR